MTLKFYFIQTKVLRNERNLIESFKLPKILNSLKFSIQTHSKNRRRGFKQNIRYIYKNQKHI